METKVAPIFLNKLFTTYLYVDSTKCGTSFILLQIDPLFGNSYLIRKGFKSNNRLEKKLSPVSTIGLGLCYGIEEIYDFVEDLKLLLVLSDHAMFARNKPPLCNDFQVKLINKIFT